MNNRVNEPRRQEIIFMRSRMSKRVMVNGRFQKKSEGRDMIQLRIVTTKNNDKEVELNLCTGTYAE